MAEYDMEHKTKDYVRRAQSNYLNKFDRVNLRLPKGSAEIIKEKVGVSINTYLVGLIKKDLLENYGISLEE